MEKEREVRQDMMQFRAVKLTPKASKNLVSFFVIFVILSPKFSQKVSQGFLKFLLWQRFNAVPVSLLLQQLFFNKMNICSPD